MTQQFRPMGKADALSRCILWVKPCGLFKTLNCGACIFKSKQREALIAPSFRKIRRHRYGAVRCGQGLRSFFQIQQDCSVIIRREPLERVGLTWVHATRSTSLFFEHLYTFRFSI